MKSAFSVGAFLLVLGGSAQMATAADVPAMPTKATVQSENKIWTTTFSLDTRYTTWRSTRGVPTLLAPLDSNGQGAQFYMPFGVSTTGTPVDNWKFEFLARSGYVYSRQQTPGLQGDVSTLTDTALSGTATYTGINGFVPFVSLNVNAPTGSAALYGASRFARMDPDVVDVALFGEGWNVGPTLGANVPITESLLATFSVGTTVRHPFNKEGNVDPVTALQPTDRINPGDVVTYTGGLTYTQGAFTSGLSLAYAVEGSTEQNGVAQYKAGDRVTLTGNAGYKWNEQWSTVLAGFWTRSDRNDVLNPAINGLEREAFNSNNELFKVGVDHTWTKGVWSLGPTASYLRRLHNAYDPRVFQFIPAKERWSAGLVGGRTYSPQLSFNARIERIWITESENPSFLVPAVATDAWLLTLGAIYNF